MIRDMMQCVTHMKHLPNSCARTGPKALITSRSRWWVSLAPDLLPEVPYSNIINNELTASQIECYGTCELYSK